MDADVWFDDRVGSELFWIAPFSDKAGATAVTGSGDLVTFTLIDDGVCIAATADDASKILSVWPMCTEVGRELDALCGRSSGLQIALPPSDTAGDSAVCMAMERL